MRWRFADWCPRARARPRRVAAAGLAHSCARRVLQRLHVLVLASLLAFGTPATAQEIPWRGGVNFDLRAEDEPLGQFLARMFALYGLPTVTSPGMADARINGRFRGRAEAVFKGISDTYGLVAYYDGSRVHLSTLAEMTSKLFYIDRADLAAVQNTLRELRLADNRFPMRVSSVDGHVLLSGPPRYVEIVTNVVNQVTSQRASDEAVLDLRVFRLRHARAADTKYSIGGTTVAVPGVARLLGELLAGAPIGAIGGDYRTEPATLPGLRGSGLAATGRAGEPASAEEPGSAQPGRRPRAGTGSPAPGADKAGGMPRPVGGAELGDESRPRPSSPFASVRAEPRINAVIVRDRRERMPIYARLIQALDVDTPLVEIEASVIDINSEKAESLGVDWRAHTRRVDVAMSPNDLSRTGLRPVEPLLSGGPGLVGTVLLGNERSYFLSRVNALADRGDARLLARPRVLTTDNSEAVLSSTRDFYVRVAGRDEVDLFNVSLGLKLRVTPALVDDPEGRRFRLIVHIEDGSASDSSAVDQIPVVSRNAISTQAVIGDGQSLLIGGYTIETRRNDQVGLPGVGSVPVLGWLFGQRSQTNTRVERMFLITPRLVQRAAPQGRVEEPAPGGASPSVPAGTATPPRR